MRTRNSNFPNNSNVTIPRRRNKGRAPNIVEPELRTIVAPMAERTMEELLRAPTEGYGEAIVLPEINADHFEIKTNLLQLVQANPFHGLENENPHAHINSFKRITSTLRFRNVPNDVIKLMMFPYSLEGAAKTWYEKEPPNSILTWEDLVTKFVNQFFPPSKTTHLKNKISRFTQKFDESFSEAWERFKEMLRACPHHGFTELTQVDTFYNGLNDNDQDSLNAAAGGNLLSKTTREALNIIENKSKVRYSRNKPNASRMNTTSRESDSKTDERIDKLADQLSTLVEIVSKKVVTPAPVKAVEETCVTCGGAHSWYNCPTTDNNQASVYVTMGTYNQVAPSNRVSNQMAPPGFAPVQNNGQNRFNQNQVQGNNFNRGNNFHGNQDFQAQNNHAQNFQNQPFKVPNNQVQQEISNDFLSYKRNNDQMLRNMQNQINSLKGDLKNEIQNTIKSQQAVKMNQQTTFQNNLQSMICGLFQNQASTSGILPSNTILNPKGKMKAITTRSGVAYEGPSIPTNHSHKKTLPKTTPIPEPDVPKSLPKPNIPYPSRRDDQKSRDKASNQKEKIFQMFQDLRFDISFADALLLMPRFAPTIKSLLMNKEKLLELAKIPLNENCSAMLLKKLLEKLEDPGKFLIPECPRSKEDDLEILLHHDPSTPMKSVASILEGYIYDPLFRRDDWIYCDLESMEVSSNIEEGYYDLEGDVIFLESLLSYETTHSLAPEELLESMRIISIECRCYAEIHLSGRQKIFIQSSRIMTLIGKRSIFGPDDSIPPGIESDIDSEEDIIDNLLNDDPIPEYERLTFDMGPDVPVINNVDELNEDECFDPGEVRLMLKSKIPSHLSFRLFSRISLTLRFLPYFPPPRMRTPFLTPASPLRAGGI
ncbi:reverse transcriptase domain-containing protein [Tanacetum coccineum]